MNVNSLLAQVTKKKEQLDQFKPLPPELINNLEHWYRTELTYNSNAIEGNTLSRSETALVLEKGLTIGGKSIREHLEAINHGFALDFIRTLTQTPRRDITLTDINDIHRLILKGIDDNHAGSFRKVVVSIAGSEVVLADPLTITDRMNEFIYWLHHTKEDPILVAIKAHLKLVTIHPYIDGNGRTARLLMNLLLMQAGYPPVVIKNEDRLTYINAIEKAQLTGDETEFEKLVLTNLIASLDKYLNAIEKSNLGKQKK